MTVFRRATVVCCYVSLPHEVETWLLVQRMSEMGKRVVIPRVRGSRLVLSELRDLQQDLRPGAFGVWEPSPRTTRPVDPERLDLVLVPGLAFDRQGHRLGRGRGYFDRLLAAVPRNIPRVGLCFDFQLFDHLPLRPHDQPVSAVLAA